MARRPRTRIRVKTPSATARAVSLLGASLDLSGRSTRAVINGRYVSKSGSTPARSDWQVIGGDFKRAVSRSTGHTDA